VVIISTPHQIIYYYDDDDDIMGGEIQGSDAEREGKRTLGRSSRRWENCIEMDLKGMLKEGVVWTQLAQDRGTPNGQLPLLQCKHEQIKGIRQF
jgi:hypothetical protein